MEKQTLTLVLTLLVLTPLSTSCSDDEEPKNPGTGGTSGAGGTGGNSDGGAGLTCAEMCAKIFPLGCSNGPPSESICTAFCNGIVGGTDMTCASAMRNLLACVPPSATVTCDADGNPTSPECASEWQAVVPCLP